MTIITDISKDHVEILGNSIRKIAWEKAGIIKPDVPMLIGSLPTEAENVIAEVSQKVSAPLARIKRSKLRIDERKLRLSYATDRFRIENLSPALVGVHQLKNTSLVLEAVNQLNTRGVVSISKTAALTGIRTTQWPGRFQMIRHPEGPLLILDVAHNAKGMEAFVDSFQRKFPGRDAKILVGFVKRKPHQQMFDSLSTIATEYAIVPLNTGRTIDVNELMAKLRWRGVPHTRFGTVRTAYKKLLQSSDQDDIIVVIGSHYLLGEFLTLNGWK